MAGNTYKERKKKKDKTKSTGRKSIPLMELIVDRRLHLAIGIFLLITTVCLFIAFTSYLFNGQKDQVVILAHEKGSLKETGLQVNNWLGLTGAWISHLFMYKWFGIASYLLLPILFGLGYWMSTRKKIPYFNHVLRWSVFLLFWGSIFFGYCVNTFKLEREFSYLSGGFGYEMAIVLHSLVGWGDILIILFVFFVFVVFYFNVHSILGVSLRKQSALEDQEDEYDEDEYEEELPESTEEDTEEQQEQNEEIEEGQDEDEPETEIILQEDEKEENKDRPDLSLEDNIEQLLAASEEEDTEDEEEEEADFEVDEGKEEEHVKDTDIAENYDPTLDLPSYKYPTLDLLNDYSTDKVQVTREELEANKNKIVDTLGNYKIGISSIKATIGPTVTLYEIVPEAGVKISKIKNLEDDIALSLAALGIRIIAPIPGRGTIGIEVPNKNRELVSFRNVASTEKFMHSDKDLPIVFGKTISNEVFVIDLAKMPHILMAGATGQGKSVGLNIILASLLYKKHPSQLKFVLVDPKKVELSIFSKIERHFLAKLPDSEEAIITDTKKVINTLNSLCIEMDARYDLLKDAGCRNLKEYNNKFVKRKLNPNNGHRFMPFIVLVIDELADLMMTAGKEVETPIARLAQLARAIGIHLVVATQRPSVNVITGIIKANFPARISFKVTSKVDSRTILDAGGADQLIGMGDMLFSQGSEMIRLQCAFADTPEIENVCEFVGSQRGYESAYHLPEYTDDESTAPGEVDLSDRDALFDDAARVIVIHQQGSTSLLQRKLKLGYNRAGRLIDQLEAAGIVGPFEGSKAREVLIPDEYSLEQLLNSLNDKHNSY